VKNLTPKTIPPGIKVFSSLGAAALAGIAFAIETAYRPLDPISIAATRVQTYAANLIFL
jgi:hypothetical protein